MLKRNQVARCLDISAFKSNVDVVIIADLYKMTVDGKRMLTMNEYENFRGRAGRLGKAKVGFSYVFVNQHSQVESWQNLKENLHNPETIVSRFLLPQDMSATQKLFGYLNLFDAKKTLSEAQLIKIVSTFPGGRAPNEIKDEVHAAIAELLRRGLLVSSYDVLQEKQTYSLSDKGVSIAGLIVSPSTYDKLMRSDWFAGDFKIFDFLYELCSCSELADKAGNTCSLSFAARFKRHLKDFWDMLTKSGGASEDCLRKIETLNEKYLARYDKKNFLMRQQI